MKAYGSGKLPKLSTVYSAVLSTTELFEVSCRKRAVAATGFPVFHAPVQSHWVAKRCVCFPGGKWLATVHNQLDYVGPVPLVLVAAHLLGYSSPESPTGPSVCPLRSTAVRRKKSRQARVSQTMVESYHDEIGGLRV
jgi:hypothetical protein